jgi:uncharacterized phage protein (TIGR01671 family)
MENREIEFRAWDISQKRMRTDITGTECYNGAVEGVYMDGDYYELIAPDTGKRLKDIIRGERYISTYEKAILMQYAGLKDKNGKKIFEGDSLGGIYEGCYVDYCDKCCSHQVFLGDKEIGCMSCQGDIGWYELLDDADLEVIGNIYENPELLEAK